MTIKQAILQALEDLRTVANYSTIYHHIVDKKYYDFDKGKTPKQTVSAILGQFIRDGDTRVSRILQEGNTYVYYLTKYEPILDLEALSNNTSSSSSAKKALTQKSFEEKDLHKLLSTFLKNISTFSKTIFHQQSQNGKDSNQVWTHPDMIGVRFVDIKNKNTRNFIKAIDPIETFRISAYEIKKEINTDYDLKKAFFQAVSNSSWANFGYLVAFSVNSSLMEEIGRLNQDFGIGFIKLDAFPFTSRILFQPQLKKLNFNTIDKLCEINSGFATFFDHVERLITAEERIYKDLEDSFSGKICDPFFRADEPEAAIEEYCRQRNIPLE